MSNNHGLQVFDIVQSSCMFAVSCDGTIEIIGFKPQNYTGQLKPSTNHIVSPNLLFWMSGYNYSIKKL